MEYTGFRRAPHFGIDFAPPMVSSNQEALGFVCQVVRQYLSSLPPEKLPFFIASINRVLCEAVKAQVASPPVSPFTVSLADAMDNGYALQREVHPRDPFDVSPTSSGWSSDSLETPPPENIAFRTIPCRNWIKFKGQCRLGNRCKFIHDPAFISSDDAAFPTSPAPHCWSYLQGTCQKGRQCKYYHPPAAHLEIYQRYTPCREWDNCTVPTCPFRHASASQSSSVKFSIDSPSPTSHKGFDEDPFLTDIQSGFGARHSFSGFNPHSSGLYQREREFSPLTSLDTIQEELGISPGGPGVATPGRRMSMVPTQTLSRMDFGGFDFGTLESLQEGPISRPRGKSFDVSFMLPQKRDSL